jgi:hypothetical protein
MGCAYSYLSKTYKRPRFTCAELRFLLKGTNVDYDSLITHFSVASTLGDPRRYCLVQTAFALIVFAMNGIQNRISGELVEPAIPEDIYLCSEQSGRGILAALWIAMGVQIQKVFRAELEPWIQVVSEHLPAQSSQRREWLNSGGADYGYFTCMDFKCSYPWEEDISESLEAE